MEVSELTLWIARLVVLVLMYGFLVAVVLAVLADARAANAVRRVAPAPAPSAAAAPVTSLQRLVVSAGTQPVTGGEYRLNGSLEIGRDAACAISIPNRFVSKRHAVVFPQDGHWLVEDLGSTNGTQVNDEAITGPHQLQPGDRLVVGDTEFTLD